MEWQGSMNLKRPITINGKPHGVEHESTLPTFQLGDDGRVVHAEDTGALWFATSTKWVELTPGGIGPHEHDEMYYTETELDAMFENKNGEKQVIDWTNVKNKPSLAPLIHGDDSHSQVYLKEEDVTYSFLNGLGLTGPGSNQIAIGNHLHGIYSLDGHVHDASVVIFNNTVSGLTATNTKAAIDEVNAKVNGLDLSYDATEIVYNPDNSTLTDITVQAAIDTIDTTIENLAFTATETEYTPTSGLLSTDTQSAIDEVNAKVDGLDLTFTSTEISYDPINSDLEKTNVQTAIDAVAEQIKSLDFSAAEINFTPVSDIIATDSQSAIAEVNAKVDSMSSLKISYDNTESELASLNVKDALDEVTSNIKALDIDAATFESLDANGDVGTSADQVAKGNHSHDNRYYTEAEADAQFALLTTLSAIGDQTTDSAHPGYQGLGLSGMTGTVESGLTQGNTYFLDITTDGILQDEISIEMIADTKAVIDGNVDLSAGHDWTNYNEVLTLDGTDLQLDATTTSISEVSDMIAANLPGTLSLSNDGTYLTLTSTVEGTDGDFTINSESTTLGFAATTYSGINASSGYQSIELSIVGTDYSGLADNTNYRIKINNIDYNIMTGVGPTYSDVVDLLNVQFTGLVASIEDGNIVIKSNTTGITSTVLIESGQITIGSEVAIVTPIDDTAKSLSSKYFTVSSKSNDYYVWYSMEESAEILAVPETSTAQMTSDVVGDYIGEFFTVYDGANAYDIWFDTTGSDATPAITNTELKVDISSETDAIGIANTVQTLTISGLSLSVNDDTVMFISDTQGTQANQIDGANATNVSVLTTTLGAEGTAAIYSTDPAALGTGLQVDILENDLALDIATATVTKLDSESELSALLDGSDIQITSLGSGNVDDVNAGDSGFSVSVSEQGTEEILDLSSNLVNFTSYGIASDGSDATFAQVTSTNDMSAGYDFNNYNEEIIIDGVNTVLLDENTNNINEIVSMINADLPIGMSTIANGNFIQIATDNAGATENIIITSGSGMTTLGIIGGTYSGTDGDGTKWDQVIAKLNGITTDATWTMNNGDVILTSDSIGIGSTISLSYADATPSLFTELTGFVAFTPAVGGLDSDTLTGSDIIGVDGIIGITPDGKSVGDGSTLQEMLLGMKSYIDTLEARIIDLEQ